ncbi:MAG: hypothetical protein NVV62_19700 [Terricaulis sp.]|nr:hypothetical protein [Terricaulis sp.]
MEGLAARKLSPNSAEVVARALA